MRLPLTAAGPDRVSFVGRGGEAEARFEGGSQGQAAAMVVRGIGPRPERFDRVEPPALTPSALAAISGRYRSAELGVEWTVVTQGAGLSVRASTGEERELVAVYKDGFTLDGSTVAVDRDPRGRVRALLVTPERSRNIRFDRVAGQ